MTKTQPNWLRATFGSYIGFVLAIAAMIVLFGSLSEYFLTTSTFTTIANDIPAIAVMAVGMTFVLIIAGIDLSVGSVMALAGATIGIAMTQWGWSLLPAMFLAMLVGVGCGFLTGMVSVAWRLPTFIVSLGMLEIARGGAYIATNSRTQYIGGAIDWLSAPLLGGISPAFMLAFLIVIAGQLLLTRTVLGRYMIGIGTNEEAMRLAGIDPRPIKVLVFALTGALAGLAGVFQTSRLEAADPNTGAGIELQVIAAVVIGGTSLMGGRGSVVNTFFGVLIISLLEAGLAQIGASDPAKRIVTGCVIIAAVVLDGYRSRQARRA
ncbi:ABC transporter permease [Chitinimonas sp.]|uniref:ABC transporter permease n=1 Tax=Chitinimonas sp. TaxID=1934313 RepID=UPI002F91CD57